MKVPIFPTLVFLFILLTHSLTANASDFKTSISGKIMDEETGMPIEYVTISLFRTIDSTLLTGTISDENGVFQLSKIDYGHFYLVFNFVGYQEKTIGDITLSKEKALIDLEIIKMGVATSRLEEVSVTAKQSSVSLNIDKQVVNVSSNLTAIGGTAADALRTAPAITTDGEGNIKLRGSTNFTVLINGKPTAMTSAEVLKQTPTDIIDKIEIVTSPSVKYNAEGTAGIVNIILKKNAKQGFNGLFDVTVGTRSKYAGNVGLNFNRKKLSIFTGVEWRDFTKTAENNYYRELYNTDTVHHAFMGQDRTIRNSNLGFRLNVNFTPKEKHDLVYSLNAGYLETEGDIIVHTSGRTVPESSELYRNNSFYIKQKPTFFTNNFNYTWKFRENQTVSINTYYSFIDYYLLTSQKLALADSDYIVIDEEPYLQDILNENYSHTTRVDVDYTHSINEHSKIETGLSTQSYTRFLDITYDQFDYTNLDWKHNRDYTNKYDFVENIYGAYANFNTKFLGIQTSIGLRVEYMDRELTQQTTQEGYTYDKVNFFPGLSLTKSFENQHSLKLALTNRINRPDEYMMNPFPEFEDDYFYSEGNPHLVPELSRALELSYQKVGEQIVFSSNVYHRRTTDKIEQKLTIGAGDKIHTIFHNDVMDQSTGVELMGKFDVRDWWSINANTNFYHYKISGHIDEDPFSQSNISWNAQLINSINIGKTSSIQVFGYYNSKTVTSQGELSSYYFVDVAFKQQLLNKMSLSLQVKDVLQSANYELKTATGNMNLLGDFNNESPIVLLTLSYQLSNYKKLTKDVQTDFDM